VDPPSLKRAPERIKVLPDPTVAVAAATLYGLDRAPAGALWKDLTDKEQTPYITQARNVQAALYVTDGRAFEAARVLAAYHPLEGQEGKPLPWLARIKACQRVTRW